MDCDSTSLLKNEKKSLFIGFVFLYARMLGCFEPHIRTICGSVCLLYNSIRINGISIKRCRAYCLLMSVFIGFRTTVTGSKMSILVGHFTQFGVDV